MTDGLDRLARLPGRWSTYLLLVGSMVAILAAGLAVPAVAGHPQGAASVNGPAPAALPTGPVQDHDPRPPAAYAGARLVPGRPVPPGTPLLASDVGITPTTITIGVVLVGLGAISAFGIDTSSLDPKVQRTYWDAAIGRLNAAGGVDGRRLQVTYATGDILSDDSMRAACQTLTVDDHVFAVANVLGVSGDPILCVTRDHQTPYIGIAGAAQSYYGLSQGRLVTLEPTIPRTLSILFGRLGPMRLVAGHRVGVLHDTGPGGTDSAALRQSLTGLGAASVVDAGLGNQDPLVVSGQVAAAEQRMQQAGVDTVLLLTNAVYGTVFATQADQNRFTPTYVMSDLGYATAGDSFLANMPASFFHRAIAVTSTEEGRGNAKLGESSLDAGCRADYTQATGRPAVPDSADAVAALASCALVQVLTMGLDAAAPNPTRATFAAGVSRAGAFTLTGFGRGLLTPTRLDAGDEVSVLQAHADCQCWFTIDGYRPAP